MEQLKELGLEALQTRERETREQIFKMRLQKSLQQLDSTARMRSTRRDLARTMTELSARRRAAAKPQAGK